MSKRQVLVIEDDPYRRGSYKTYLERAGYAPRLVEGKTVAQLMTNAASECERDEFHCLVLDLWIKARREEGNAVQLYGNSFCGILIYVKLMDLGLTKKFDHVVVASRLIAREMKDVGCDDVAFPIRVFVDVAQIPYENVIDVSEDEGFMHVCRRLNELAMGL